MTPANDQGQNGTNGTGSTGGTTGGTGMEPSTPAMGASSTTTGPAASGIGISDAATRGSGPDSSQSSTATGSTTGQTGMTQTGMTSGGGMSGSTDMTGGGSGGQQKFTAVREQASKLRGQATDRARTAAESGKDRATQTLDGLAQEVHDAAGNLEQQVGPQVAQYAHRAADALDELSASLRNKSVDELMDDVQGYMRRSPAVAIGAAVAVGFALSRFLKASSPTRSGSYGGSYASGGYATGNGSDMAGIGGTGSSSMGSGRTGYNA